MTKNDDSSRVRTCTASELDGLTSSGWRLRDIREEDHQEPGMSYCANEMHRDGYTVSLTKTPPPVVVRRSLFILERSRDEEMALLREETKSALEKVHATHLQVDEATKAAKEAQILAEARLKELAAAESEHQALKVAYGALRDANRKLETDIGKIRKEIGDGRLREILNPSGE